MSCGGGSGEDEEVDHEKHEDAVLYGRDSCWVVSQFPHPLHHGEQLPPTPQPPPTIPSHTNAPLTF